MGQATPRRTAWAQGIAASPQAGRPSRLTPSQWQELLGLLAQSPKQSGFETERWTLPRIRVVIERRWGVSYHVDYLSTRLRKLGWSAQVPAVRAAERDEDLIRAWLDRDWPRIKKRLAAGAP
jgi:transposase